MVSMAQQGVELKAPTVLWPFHHPRHIACGLNGLADTDSLSKDSSKFRFESYPKLRGLLSKRGLSLFLRLSRTAAPGRGAAVFFPLSALWIISHRPSAQRLRTTGQEPWWSLIPRK
jgi:hypothetical protein